MKPHVSAITLGVRNLEASKRFYADGLGWPVALDSPGWVAFAAAPLVGLHPLDALADDAGTAPNGAGAGSIVFSYIVRSSEQVDAVLAEAERAGGSIVRRAGHGSWGGYFGYFADPDGHLWKVAMGEGEQPYAE